MLQRHSARISANKIVRLDMVRLRLRFLLSQRINKTILLTELSAVNLAHEIMLLSDVGLTSEYTYI